jgi:hypothetical protein
MELERAVEYANDPGRVIDPRTCNLFVALISRSITDREKQEQRLKVDEERDRSYEQYETAAVPDRKMKLTPVYVNMGGHEERTEAFHEASCNAS